MAKFFQHPISILHLLMFLLIFSGLLGAQTAPNLEMPLSPSKSQLATPDSNKSLSLSALLASETHANLAPIVQSETQGLGEKSENTNESVDSIPTTAPQTPTAKTETTTKQQQSVAKTQIGVDHSEFQSLQEQLQRLKLHNAILSTQNLIQTEKYQRELLQLRQETEKLQLVNELQREKNRQQLTQLHAEKNQLLLENELYNAKQTQVLSELNVLKTRLELENQIYQQEKQKILAEFEAQREQLAIQNAIVEQKQKHEELRIQLETAKLNFDVAKLEFTKNKRTLELEELTEKLSEREQKELWESQVNKPKRYLKEPFVDGYLVISDRRIELEQVILPGTAAYVNERIHYFNNKSVEYPIFLLIDTCYGGSVMEGAKIIEAMHSSRAPVYVVVKTLAASLAAVLTSLSERSFAYPNAIIVHHQIMSSAAGNPKQIKEQLDIAHEWTNRIMKPVAQKMGLTAEQFVAQMYQNNSSGEWYEFADVAAQLKWVDVVIKDIRDTSFTKKPLDMYLEEEEEIIMMVDKKEKIDSQGQRYVTLPRLNLLDMYFLYNPNNYYR
jgi:ATP-dependent Clp protease protease subunit